LHGACATDHVPCQHVPCQHVSCQHVPCQLFCRTDMSRTGSADSRSVDCSLALLSNALSSQSLLVAIENMVGWQTSRLLKYLADAFVVMCFTRYQPRKRCSLPPDVRGKSKEVGSFGCPSGCTLAVYAPCCGDDQWRLALLPLQAASTAAFAVLKFPLLCRQR
jgi:hypothetical protein